MTTLRVLLTEHWPEPAEAAWVLLGNDGKVESEGTSDPRHWPKAQHTEALLIGGQASWHTVRVPRASLREQAKSIGFALEDQLVREPDSQHITPSLQEAESWSVWVIARECMKRLTAQFAAISRPLDAIYAAAQSIPMAEGAWSIAIQGASVWVKTGPHAGFADDLPEDGTAPPLLTTAIELARTQATLPHTLRIFGADIRTQDTRQWGEALGIPTETDPHWAWYALPGDAANLLHGEFSSHHRHGDLIKRIKPAIVLAGLVIAAHLALSVIEIGIRRSQLSSYKSEMTQLLHSQLPNISVQDPPNQIRREVNKQRTAHGQLADDEPLSLLADLSAALGADASAAVQSMQYEGSTLTVTFNSGKTDAQALVQRLAARNITATRRNDGAQLTLRRTS